MGTSHRLVLPLIFLPPLLLLTYFFSHFPGPPTSLHVHPSLSSLSPDLHALSCYPEDIYPGGAYVSLPYGRVRYWIMGPEDGEKVVLIHGLSMPSIVWKNIVPVLVERGYRVMLYDLYGRGYTDAPKTIYDTRLYTTQLALLMQHVHWDSAHIVGLSMGGGVAAAFTAQFPQLTSGKTVLIASAGIIESWDIPKTVKFMSSPLVQSLYSLSPFQQYMRRLAKSNASEADDGGKLSDVDEMMQLVRLQSAHLPYFNAAIASSLRDGPIRGLHSELRTLGERNTEVLLIHGTADKTVPYSYASQMRTLIPNAKLATIENGGHEIILTHSPFVSDTILEFLKTSEA